jgi:hypothetical protein
MECCHLATCYAQDISRLDLAILAYSYPLCEKELETENTTLAQLRELDRQSHILFG